MKKFWFILLIFISVILQVSFYIADVSQIVPDISLLLLVLYSMNGRNKDEASAVAIGVGLFQDLMIGRALGVYALGKLLVVYVAGWLGEKDFMEDNTIGVFFLLILSNVFYWVLIWTVFTLGFRVEIMFFNYLQDYLFLQSLIFGILGIFLYPKVKKLVKRRGHLFPYV
ncbi:rod shape-determining protein MreD [Natranaerofaba carboxydovora]|uniref:rod shape-determining protein MreD n=1 Tax=Natranaerofaba carboxydovora TaxID=2742683 RepID=UPI001F12A799|nr:rod shape-determining protein MreD [Natranaerofaba carboxydovora]UMZ72870.1 shape_MreD: rod shape-determining protein MreD [Natranaerofaba carboxydovora]